MWAGELRQVAYYTMALRVQVDPGYWEALKSFAEQGLQGPQG